jgi:AhpD family alkylhydroperoxidase
MARINPIEPQDATPVIKALYQDLRTSLLIEPNNYFKTLAHTPELLKPLIELSRAMLESGLLDRRLNEWVILQVARQNQCPYVFDAHKQALSKAMMNDILDDFRLPMDTSSLNENEKLAIRYAEQITHNKVEEATFQALSAIFNAEEIVELTVLASYYNCICRMVDALGVDMEDLQFLEPSR